MRKSPPMWKYWTEVLANAKTEGKVPVLIVQKSGTPTYMAIMELERHAKFENMIDLHIAGYHKEAQNLLSELSGIENTNVQVNQSDRQARLEHLVDLIQSEHAEEAVQLAKELVNERKQP